MIRGRKILLGVTGSIAAYKAAMLVRLLVKEGAEVKVVMTEGATGFITPLTLSVLSKNPVFTTFTEEKSGTWNNHVDLALWADVFVIAPLSAKTLSAMASGYCDSILLACYLSARCPVVIAPAMDVDMWHHPATKSNVESLLSRGHHLISPADGELASGLTGEGRMEEPEHIVEELRKILSQGMPLSGKKAMVTAGPTQEPIDPVRYIGNRSSGKMGFAIAEELARKGAAVTLITGPTSEHTNVGGIERIDITDAESMYRECMTHSPGNDIVVMSAAVADYRPESATTEKIKKDSASMNISLAKTKDILASLGERKTQGQVLVGFALETGSGEDEAKRKLRNKNLDFIVLNSMSDEGAGFGHSTNKVTIFDRTEKAIRFELKTKAEVARDIVNTIVTSLNNHADA